jgi:hypothetical protein
MLVIVENIAFDEKPITWVVDVCFVFLARVVKARRTGPSKVDSRRAAARGVSSSLPSQNSNPTPGSIPRDN